VARTKQSAAKVERLRKLRERWKERRSERWKERAKNAA